MHSPWAFKVLTKITKETAIDHRLLLDKLSSLLPQIWPMADIPSSKALRQSSARATKVILGVGLRTGGNDHGGFGAEGGFTLVIELKDFTLKV